MFHGAFIMYHFLVGIIIFYELWIRNVRDATSPRLIFNPSGQYDPLGFPTALPPPATSYTVNNLSPFTEYNLQIISVNQAGKVASNWTRSRTSQAGKFQAKYWAYCIAFG